MTGPANGAPRCWNCGYGQPYVAPQFRGRLCVFCGADLYRAVPAARVRWRAHRPAGAPAPVPKSITSPYQGPPRYRYLPRWGFEPSIWVTPPVGTGSAASPAAPVRDLRSVTILAVAAAVMCLLSAGFEGWRYLLLVRGRTEVLRAGEVRLDDALVVAAGWSAVLLAVATAIALLPVLGRLEAFASRRADVRAARRPGQRLSLLLVPGWNLYGAGVVLAEIDALLQLPSAKPVEPASYSLRSPMRWRTRELPSVAGPPRDPAVAPPAVTGPVFRTPRRLIIWWWAAWVVNGLLAAALLIRALIPGDLQVQADLVWLHVVLQLLGAAVALLTAAVLRAWIRQLQPTTESWPAGWVLQPSAPAEGKVPTPLPATELTGS